jgi:predicted transcriptional regulator
MDELRIITYSMIFKILDSLRDGPLTIDQLEETCMIKQNDLRAILSSAIYRGLIEQRSYEFRMTRKGARTAIYLLILYESVNYPKNEYREIMHAFNRVLVNSDSQTAIS